MHTETYQSFLEDARTILKVLLPELPIEFMHVESGGVWIPGKPLQLWRRIYSIGPQEIDEGTRVFIIYSDSIEELPCPTSFGWEKEASKQHLELSSEQIKELANQSVALVLIDYKFDTSAYDFEEKFKRYAYVEVLTKETLEEMLDA